MAATHLFKFRIASLMLAVAMTSLSACAATRQDDATVVGAEALSLAKERYDRAKQAYEDAVAKCLRASARKLDGNPFEGLELSTKQMEVAAYVIAERAMEACEGDVRNRFAFELGIYKAVAMRYGSRIPKSVTDDEQTLFSQRWRQLEKEAGEYATINSEQRAALESHAALQVPFDFAEFLSRLRKTE